MRYRIFAVALRGIPAWIKRVPSLTPGGDPPIRKYVLVAVGLVFVVGTGHAAQLGFDNFDYADGSLVVNSARVWANHSGTADDLLVASGQAVVQHGAPSEDANYAFTSQTAGSVYFGIDFSVDNLGAPYSGTDDEYFASFRDGFALNGRLYIVEPGASGDYTVGIATTGGTAEAVWATDLTFGTTYRAIVRYDIDNDQAELWIDAATLADTSILGAALGGPGDNVSSFALRQSDSSENETVRVDNLVIAGGFDEVVVAVPVELQSFSIE